VILLITILVWALCYYPRPGAVEQTARAAFLAEQGLQEEPTDEETLAAMALSVDGALLRQSYMARMGSAVQPIFAAAGFDWKITSAVLASFPAREVFVATMGIIYNLGGDVDEDSGDLRERLAKEIWEDGPRVGQPVFTLPVVIAVMVFFALCMQCGSTMAVIAKESGWKWAWFVFAYMTGLAWVMAVVVYQAGSVWIG
jgi:ferrous iron transport protein B